MKNINSKTYANRAETARITFIMLLVITAFLIVGHIETHYSMIATVTYINNNDYVTVVDSKGDTWAFYGTDFSIGDKVKLKMFTNCTDSIYDDEVVGAVKM